MILSEKPRTFRRPDTRHLLCCLLVNALFCRRQTGNTAVSLEGAQGGDVEAAGFRRWREHQLDAERCYFQGTTETPRGGRARRLLTLCSGHRTEKFSSLSAQPEETHTPTRSGSGRERVSQVSGSGSGRHLTGWHICSENCCCSPSGSSP